VTVTVVLLRTHTGRDCETALLALANPPIRISRGVEVQHDPMVYLAWTVKRNPLLSFACTNQHRSATRKFVWDFVRRFDICDDAPGKKSETIPPREF
jgi:hypothetical protein